MRETMFHPPNSQMSRSPHILIVDDDREIRNLLMRFLTEHGFRVTPVADGRGMQSALKNGRFDLVVLDVMLPGDDGLTLCRRLRHEIQIPILMLTALSSEADRILGLELGADDYLTKPFSPRELVARIKAILRRAATARAEEIERPYAYAFAGWTVELPRRQLRSPEGTLLTLTSGEFDLLIAFAEHPQRMLSRDQLLDLTRGRTSVLFDRSIDVQVSRLRKKIELDPNAPELIKTVRSGGYIFTPEVKALQAA
jgi:two-component system OmpR family response regulator